LTTYLILQFNQCIGVDMRLCFHLQPKPRQVLPFDYQHELVRTFHKWLPENDIHDDISLYSLSWLHGAKAVGGGLSFPQGASWSVGFYDERVAKHLLVGVLRLPETTFGMRTVDVQIIETPEFYPETRFVLASPALVKYFDGSSIRHLTFDDERADEIMTATMRKKLRAAGLADDISIYFDRSYSGAKTKVVNIKGVGNRANVCPVIVRGTPETVGFAWAVGVGHCTGTGFGAVV